MSYDEFVEYYYTLTKEAEEQFGTESQYLSDLIDEYNEIAEPNVTTGTIFATAMYDSMKKQNDMIFLNLAKKFFEN